MKIKANGKLYDPASRPLELGEQRRLKHEFGLVPGRDDLDLRDPDHIAAFLYAAIREANPDMPANALMALINGTRKVEFVNDDGSEILDEGEIDAPDPTAEGEGGKKGARAGK